MTDEQQSTPTLRSAAQRKGWQYAIEHPEEATHPKIAAAAGVAESTVAKWLKRWRAEIGDHLFRGELAAERADRTEAARAEAEIGWAELRATEARNAGVTAGRIRNRMLELLPSVATVRVDRGDDGTAAPVVVHGPSAMEIERLSRAYERLLIGAELIDGHPSRHTMRSVPSDQWTPPQLGAGAGMTADEKRAKVLDIRERILERRAAGG